VSQIKFVFMDILRMMLPYATVFFSLLFLGAMSSRMKREKAAKKEISKGEDLPAMQDEKEPIEVIRANESIIEVDALLDGECAIVIAKLYPNMPYLMKFHKITNTTVYIENITLSKGKVMIFRSDFETHFTIIERNVKE